MGPTLELINPAWDNALAESWAASGLNGTPGERNGVFVGVPAPEYPSAVHCRAYPNPFADNLTIRIDGMEIIRDFSLSLYNLFGQEVQRIEGISSSQVIIQGKGLQAGAYFFHLRDESGSVIYSGKLIRK
jgi:hypothetical protein